MCAVLRNRKVLVTGSNRGVGLAISLHLMKNGWTVGLCMREGSENRLSKFKKLINKTGSEIFIADLCSYNEVDKMVKQIKNWSDGVINGLVNNAGQAHGDLIQTTRIDDVKKIFDVNFFSVLNFTQKIHRYLRKAKGAAIVNISSISSLMPDVGQVAYGSSKAALNSLTKTMAQEFMKNNITVNAILPAAVTTGMSSQMSDKALQRQIALMALEQRVDEKNIVELISFLLDRRAESITGQLIRLDNGIPF